MIYFITLQKLILLLSLKYRYLSIIKKEGLEISQPALDPEKSELHHPITARDKKSTVHRFSVCLRNLCSRMKSYFFLLMIIQGCFNYQLINVWSQVAYPSNNIFCTRIVKNFWNLVITFYPLILVKVNLFVHIHNLCTYDRRTYKVIGRTRCNENSTGPPCTG